MKKKFQHYTLLAAVAVFAFSSCNRGYGCPTNFSIDDVLYDLVALSLPFLF